MFNIFIFEDDPYFRDFLRTTVRDFFKDKENTIDVEAPGNFRNWQEKIEKKGTNFDHNIFFLDIDLAHNFSGIDLAITIRHIMPNSLLIFVTGFEKHAVDVLNSELNPVAYLIKQITPKENSKSINKVLDKALSIINSESKFKTISFQNGKDKFQIFEDEILYVTTSYEGRKLLKICLFDSYLIAQGTLKDLKNKLSDDIFIKDLKAYILNKNQIKKITRSENQIEFKNGSQIYLSGPSITKITNKYN
jgi:two-component system, LytTR family, response regulator AgrA